MSHVRLLWSPLHAWLLCGALAILQLGPGSSLATTSIDIGFPDDCEDGFANCLAPVGEYSFNPFLRADFLPLTPVQQDGGIPPNFSSGATSGNEVVSELYPTLPEDQLLQLRRSACFWQPLNESVNLSWESVITVISPVNIRLTRPLSNQSVSRSRKRASKG